MYIVVELQTNESGKITPLVSASLEAPQAEQKYHTVLAAASVSNVAKHSAVILNDEGMAMASQCYTHGSKPDEEDAL